MRKNTHSVIPRVLCFVFNKDSVLLLKASKEKDWFGFYEPPGGHIEQGESIIACAEKEIFEETGVRVNKTKLAGIIHVSGFYGKDIMLFVTKSITHSTELTGSKEGEPVWIQINNLKNVNLIEDIKPILEKILELKNEEIFIGNSEFDGKDKLVSMEIKLN